MTQDIRQIFGRPYNISFNQNNLSTQVRNVNKSSAYLLRLHVHISEMGHMYVKHVMMKSRLYANTLTFNCLILFL